VINVLARLKEHFPFQPAPDPVLLEIEKRLISGASLNLSESFTRKLSISIDSNG
jgi:hypothetical protein